MLGLLVTGIIGWRAYFSAYFSVDTVRIGLLLHALFGFLLICSVIVHIYAGIWVRGSIRAMTRGKVSYGWAWKDRKSTRLNSSHVASSYAVCCLKKKRHCGWSWA